jgi:hypothetical protein
MDPSLEKVWVSYSMILNLFLGYGTSVGVSFKLVGECGRRAGEWVAEWILCWRRFG